MNTKAAKNAPRDIFLHLLNILAFYASAFSFIALWIQYVNARYPDPLNFYFQGILQSILWSTSVLVVAFPVYLITLWLIVRDCAAAPEKRELKIRKWLVYLTLFLSAITIIGDLITLIYNFLDGELSMRFFLKIIVVLAVAAAVLAYFLWDLKNPRGIPPRQLKMAMAGAALVIIASVIAGFLIVGTPAVQRNRRFDETRVSDLSAIQNQIINYWTQKQKLPAALADLQDSISGFAVPSDPDTAMPYEYRTTGPLAFEFCAVFAGEQKSQNQTGIYAIPVRPYGGKYPIAENWTHGIGRTCFSRAIDPELYRPAPATKPFAPVE